MVEEGTKGVEEEEETQEAVGEQKEGREREEKEGEERTSPKGRSGRGWTKQPQQRG
jgi:hypothetical protein